jgi:hypothetical protein
LAIKKGSPSGKQGAVIVYAIPQLQQIPDYQAMILTDADEFDPTTNTYCWHRLVRESRYSPTPTQLTTKADQSDFVYGPICSDVEEPPNYLNWIPQAFDGPEQLAAKQERFARFLNEHLIGAIIDPPPTGIRHNVTVPYHVSSFGDHQWNPNCYW